jgi:fatty-acyl-CoA synthase
MNWDQHYDWIAKWAHYLPDKLAFKEAESGRSISFAELHQDAEALANALLDVHQLKPGDRIAILSENCIENIILFSVAQKVGVCLVPINYRLSPIEISNLLQDCTPRLVIYESKFVHLLPSHLTHQNNNCFLDFVALRKLISAGKVMPARESIHHQFQEDDPIFILYTSGSTGMPKGALYTRKMMLWNSINTSLSISIGSDTRTVMCMPPFHTGGWNVLTTPLMLYGAYTCLVKKFDPDHIIHLIETERPQIFMAVPTMLKLMAESERFHKADFSSLSYLIVGGEPMPIPLIEQWHHKGVKIRQGYGMTEVGPNLTSLHHDYAISKKGSIGKANFFLDFKILNDRGYEVASGEAGELVFRGPVVTPGYWNNLQASALSIRNAWFHTGDLARMDSEGFLYIVDRLKNMYITGGENVYPAEIERILSTCPGVSMAAVIPIKDQKWGEAGVGFIVPETDYYLTEEEVLQFCRQNLAKYKIPKKIVFIEQLPKTDSGKIDKKTLYAHL